MPQSDNKHAIAMYNGIEQHIGHTQAEEFLAQLPLSKSADYLKKFAWATHVCAYLEERFSAEDIAQIRAACSCDPGGKAAKAKTLYEASANLQEFCARFNQAYAPENILETKDDALFLIYPTCYCSCVNRIDKQLPAIWCYCTLGYTKKMFEHILERSVTVELLESVKTGDGRCVIKIDWSN